MSIRAVGAQEAGECLAERPTGLRDLGLRVAGSQFESQLEAPTPREQREQMIEDRNPRRDVRCSIS